MAEGFKDAILAPHNSQSGVRSYRVTSLRVIVRMKARDRKNRVYVMKGRIKYDRYRPINIGSFGHRHGERFVSFGFGNMFCLERQGKLSLKQQSSARTNDIAQGAPIPDNHIEVYRRSRERIDNAGFEIENATQDR